MNNTRQSQGRTKTSIITILTCNSATIPPQTPPVTPGPPPSWITRWCSTWRRWAPSGRPVFRAGPSWCPRRSGTCPLARTTTKTMSSVPSSATPPRRSVTIWSHWCSPSPCPAPSPRAALLSRWATACHNIHMSILLDNTDQGDLLAMKGTSTFFIFIGRKDHAQVSGLIPASCHS